MQFWWFFVAFSDFFWRSLQTSLLCIVGELAGGGYVAMAVFGVSDMWPSDRWQVKGNTGHMTCDNWHVTPDMWHLTCGRWFFSTLQEVQCLSYLGLFFTVFLFVAKFYCPDRPFLFSKALDALGGWRTTRWSMTAPFLQQHYQYIRHWRIGLQRHVTQVFFLMYIPSKIVFSYWHTITTLCIHQHK